MTGFLVSDKTTLLNRIIHDKQGFCLSSYPRK